MNDGINQHVSNTAERTIFQKENLRTTKYTGLALQEQMKRQTDINNIVSSKLIYTANSKQSLGLCGTGKPLA